MKDLALFIRKNLVQFIVLVTIISTAGIMLSNAYVNQERPKQGLILEQISQDETLTYYFDLHVYEEYGQEKCIVFISVSAEDEVVIIDDNLFRHKGKNFDLYLFIENAPMFDNMYEASEWYYDNLL